MGYISAVFTFGKTPSTKYVLETTGMVRYQENEDTQDACNFYRAEVLAIRRTATLPWSPC